MAVLRFIWPIIAALLTVLLVIKIFLAALIGKPVLLALVGLALCFYLLFMLEGLQVAGLKIKDLEPDGMKRLLGDNENIKRKVYPVYETFHKKFDGFVTGRQVFVIMTVVTLAFLTKGVLALCGPGGGAPGSDPGTGSWLLAWLIKSPCYVGDAAQAALSDRGLAATAPTLFGFLDSTIYTFASATLIPAWISQLYPQFFADRRAISFICLPGSRMVLRFAMFLDEIQLGTPSHLLLAFVNRVTGKTSVEKLPIGESAYYAASLDFYGKATKQHDIHFELGQNTTVRETVTYIFKHGSWDHLSHSIKLAAPIIGDIRGTVEMPEGVRIEVDATKDVIEVRGQRFYDYELSIGLNTQLPRGGIDRAQETEEVVLSLEYQTEAYDVASKRKQATELSWALPIETANVFIRSDQVLKAPKVAVVEEVCGEYLMDEGNDSRWDLTEHTDHTASIHIPHPLVARVYQVQFEVMGASVDPPATKVKPRGTPQYT